MKGCPFCNVKVSGMCNAESSTGLRCTRKKGHSGQHIACGSKEHELQTWEPVQPEEMYYESKINNKLKESNE